MKKWVLRDDVFQMCSCLVSPLHSPSENVLFSMSMCYLFYIPLSSPSVAVADVKLVSGWLLVRVLPVRSGHK